MLKIQEYIEIYFTFIEYMELEFYSKAVPSLVVVRQNFSANTLFVTMSPNPSTMISVKKKFGNKTKTFRQPYGKLPQRLQYSYCIRVLKTAYNYSIDTKIYGTWELNKNGNVHFHFLFEDPNINTETMIHILRRDVYNSELVRHNLSSNKTDYMNNIVKLTDSIEDRYKYIHKDNNAHYLPYYSTCNLSGLQEVNGVLGVSPAKSLEHLAERPQARDECETRNSLNTPIGLLYIPDHEERRLIRIHRIINTNT
jgi:hypothetical protein